MFMGASRLIYLIQNMNNIAFSLVERRPNAFFIGQLGMKNENDGGMKRAKKSKYI